MNVAEAAQGLSTWEKLLANVRRTVSPSGLKAVAARTAGSLVVTAGVGVAGFAGVPAASYINDKLLGGKAGETPPFFLSVATAAAIGGIFGAIAGAAFPQMGTRNPSAIVMALDQAKYAVGESSEALPLLQRAQDLAKQTPMNTADVVKSLATAERALDNNLPLAEEALRVARKAAATPTRGAAALDQARKGAMSTSALNGAIMLAVNSLLGWLKPDLDPDDDDGGYLGHEKTAPKPQATTG